MAAPPSLRWTAWPGKPHRELASHPAMRYFRTPDRILLAVTQRLGPASGHWRCTVLLVAARPAPARPARPPRRGSARADSGSRGLGGAAWLRRIAPVPGLQSPPGLIGSFAGSWLFQ